MDKVNKQELRRLAEEIVSRGPRQDECTPVMTVEPSAILSLLDELEKVDADRKACWAEFKALRRTADGNERYLRDELEQYRKDAERYEFVRALENDCWMLNALQCVSGKELDEAIDAELAKEGGANG